MSLSLSALCFFILTSSLHSFPLHCLSSPVPYPPSLLLRSSHITLPSLSHPSTLFTLPPFHLTPHTSLHPIPSLCTLHPPPPTPSPHSSHITLLLPFTFPPLHPSLPHPFTLTPPPHFSHISSPHAFTLHPSTPPHVLLDNEVTAVSTIWRAQPDSKTVSVIPDSLAM